MDVMSEKVRVPIGAAWCRKKEHKDKAVSYILRHDGFPLLFKGCSNYSRKYSELAVVVTAAAAQVHH